MKKKDELIYELEETKKELNCYKTVLKDYFKNSQMSKMQKATELAVKKLDSTIKGFWCNLRFVRADTVGFWFTYYMLENGTYINNTISIRNNEVEAVE